MVCWKILVAFTGQTHHCGGFIDNHETGSRYSFEERPQMDIIAHMSEVFVDILE